MKDYVIELEKDKQPFFDPIYSLGLVELETLKIYIKTNLVNSFIRLFKFSIKAPILFDRKPDKCLWLCVDYRGLNNITMKNSYPLLLMFQSLDWLSQAKQFTYLDLTNIYHQIRICEGDK